MKAKAEPKAPRANAPLEEAPAPALTSAAVPGRLPVETPNTDEAKRKATQRKLKKLRQIEELEKKQQQGNELNEDQLMKMSKKAGLEADLKAMLTCDALLRQQEALPVRLEKTLSSIPNEHIIALDPPDKKRFRAERKLLKTLRRIEELEKALQLGNELNDDQLIKISKKASLEADLKAMLTTRSLSDADTAVGTAYESGAEEEHTQLAQLPLHHMPEQTLLQDACQLVKGAIGSAVPSSYTGRGIPLRLLAQNCEVAWEVKTACGRRIRTRAIGGDNDREDLSDFENSRKLSREVRAIVVEDAEELRSVATREIRRSMKEKTKKIAKKYRIMAVLDEVKYVWTERGVSMIRNAPEEHSRLVARLGSPVAGDTVSLAARDALRSENQWNAALHDGAVRLLSEALHVPTGATW